MSVNISTFAIYIFWGFWQLIFIESILEETIAIQFDFRDDKVKRAVMT